MKLTAAIVLCWFLTACTNTSVDSTRQSEENRNHFAIKYARGFELDSVAGGILMKNLRPYPGAIESINYFLYEEEGIQIPPGSIGIKIPVKTIILTSTSHVPLLSYLGGANILTGFPGTDYISDEAVRKRIEEGFVQDIGNTAELNLEKVVELDADLIMSYSMNDLSKMERLQNMGQQIILNSDFMESNPLGRAEWVKVMGLLVGKYSTADSLFNHISEEYMRLKNSVAEGGEKPCVFSGSVYGDAWFMPGGENYAAQLLRDAGYTYVWPEDQNTDFLELSFEAVFEKAIDCSYWIGPAPFEDLAKLGDADSRYTEFTAYKQQRVYVYDNKIGPTGGNEYLEEGYLRPDIIIKDLIKIRDPEQLPNHKLYFYRQLK